MLRLCGLVEQITLRRPIPSRLACPELLGELVAGKPLPQGGLIDALPAASCPVTTFLLRQRQ